ncbi:hypothetical protein EMCG_09212 [[Emmonsia] crescens]|uniref:Uncharacterized protein n=1 Tax=[Emmonsia] crescens TaxID=73230 RepID=A0A0G2J3D6_9EURO|nr:hypothetical protein EMCG_09212 [Emmonsia crescens UAMH 3008]
MHAALLSADDVTIQFACKEYAKERWNRDEFMDNAAIKLLTGMLAPLYMWRGGRMEPELRMGLLQWNAEHSISWLFSIRPQWQPSPNAQREQKIMSDVNEHIRELDDVRTALAARVTGAFAPLLGGDSNSGVATQMRLVLLKLADAYEDNFQMERHSSR